MMTDEYRWSNGSHCQPQYIIVDKEVLVLSLKGWKALSKRYYPLPEVNDNDGRS